MKIIEAVSKEEKSVTLGSLSPGDVFRFAYDSFDTALKENLFYMIVKDPNSEKSGVFILAISGHECLRRDKEHRVIKHDAQFSVWR